MTWDPQWDWAWVPIRQDASFGDNLPFDLVRLFVVVVGIVLMFVTARVMVEQKRRAEEFPVTQVGRFVSLAILNGYVVSTEIAVFGTPGTPRLFVGLLGIALGIWGVHGMRRKQLRQPVL